MFPGSGRLPGGGNGNPLQYSCLENPMDRGAWRATVHGLVESDTTEHARTHEDFIMWARSIINSPPVPLPSPKECGGGVGLETPGF